MGIQQIIDNPGVGEWTLASSSAGATSDPGSGNWQVTAANDRIDINTDDITGYDSSAMFDGVDVGSVLYFRVAGKMRSYVVTSKTAQAGYYEFGVNPVYSESTGFVLADSEVHSVKVYNPSNSASPPGDVAVFSATALIPAGTPIAAGNTTGDTPIPYDAGTLGNRILVVINGMPKTVGAGRDIQESSPAAGSFTYIFPLQAGDVVQMIPR